MSTTYRVASTTARSTGVADEHGRSWAFDATGVANVDVYAAIYFARMGRFGYSVEPAPPPADQVPPFMPPPPSSDVTSRQLDSSGLIDQRVIPGGEARVHRFPLTVFGPEELARGIKSEFSAGDRRKIIAFLTDGASEAGVRRPTVEQLSEKVLEEFTQREVHDVIRALGGLVPPRQAAAPVEPPGALDTAPEVPPPAPPPAPPPEFPRRHPEHPDGPPVVAPAAADTGGKTKKNPKGEKE